MLKPYFRRIWSYWMAMGHLIGMVTTPVHLFLVYTLVFGPTHLGALLLRKDPLDRTLRKAPSFWRKKEAIPPTLENLRHMF